MWIKNAAVFGIKKFALPLPIPANLMFEPIGDLQVESCGWGPVQGAPTLGIPDHTLLYFVQERKHIPKSAVDTLLEQRVAQKEKHEGFAPGKKATKELRERIVDQLLPRALSTRRRTAVWIDMKNERLVIDTASKPVIDAVLKHLLKTFEKINIGDVSWPRATRITHWLSDEPAGFALDDEISIRHPGEHGKTVKFKSADLAGRDVTEHIKQGASVETMAMTFDGRISFVMTEDCAVRRIKALGILKEAEKTDDDRFVNDFYLMTQEVGGLLNALIAEA